MSREKSRIDFKDECPTILFDNVHRREIVFLRLVSSPFLSRLFRRLS